MLKRRMLNQFILALAFVVATSTAGQSGERALTNYLAGYYGDFAVAVEPSEGLYTYATAYTYSAVAEGPNAPSGFELNGILAITGFQYVTPWRVLGARYAVAGYTTYLSGDLSLDNVGGFSGTGKGLGDSSVSPVVLYWNVGRNFHVSFYESIILPTGSFNPARAVNLGRNYVSFDSVLSLTWLDLQRGVELSVVPGIMFNTTNEVTKYRTGTELHVDAMANLYLTANVALGVHGYYYEQLAQDEIGDTELGLRAYSIGLGPAFLLVPATDKGKIVCKWIHEVDARDRFRGDILSLTAVLPF